MATNLNINPGLIEEAQFIGHHATKRAAVIEALEEYIRRRKQLKILDLFGKVDYDADFDYKEQRKKQ